MAPYHPIIVCRSDGLLEYKTRVGAKELNQPTPKQLEEIPNAKGVVDCYKKVGLNDQKSIDWRRKLGGMTMHLLGEKEHHNKIYILKDLPDGYVLWEHVKYTVDKKTGEKTKSVGNHAAGVHDRQDAYLYGHPEGRKKRYRSPAEFFPHLLWLLTDKEGDPLNCSCRICAPDEDDDGGDLEVVGEGAAKKETKPPVPSTASVIATIPAAAHVPNATERPAPAASSSIIRSREQQRDSDANGPFLYRQGELIWFSKGAAWGLAVISKRQVHSKTARYLIQPLSHPLNHPSPQIIGQNEIRPWLAWSVPSPTHTALAQLAYDQVPWDRVLRKEFGSGDAEVDGSILAAKSIDASYSLFERIPSPNGAAPNDVYYNGMFLGAEKVWVGEPVRLKVLNNDNIIMVIQSMIETTVSGTSNVTFVGDVYKFVDGTNQYKDRKDWPIPLLPPRMVADLRFRNETAENAGKRIFSEWVMTEKSAKRGLQDIKGRWYETKTLLPLLRTAELFQQEIRQGVTSDAGLWMNGRGDNASGTGKRKKNRRDTFGSAVPQDFVVSRGLDGLPADDAFPDEKPASSDLGQFMDLDGAQQHNFYADAMQQ